MKCLLCSIDNNNYLSTGKLCTTCIGNAHYSCLLEHYRNVQTTVTPGKSRLWTLANLYWRDHIKFEHSAIDLI